MPDCSAVTVTAYLPDGTTQAEAEALMEELGDITNDDGWDWLALKSDFNSEAHADAELGEVQWSDYDCPWGTTTPEDAGLFTELRKRGIAYEATDYGHYTWDGSTEIWRPGMAEPITTTSGIEGDPFVPMSAIQAIADETSTGAEFRRTLLARIKPFITSVESSV